MKYSLLFLFGIFVIPMSVAAYPGCAYRDIIIGGQMWASCNVSEKGVGSPDDSGWFHATDKSPRFISENGLGSTLEYLRGSKNSRNIGPCLSGYRLPTRGEWETALSYARMNRTSLGELLNLPYNGGYRTFRDTEGDIVVEERENTLGAYWSSTYESIWGYESPIILHLGGNTSGYRLDGTHGSTYDRGYQFQYGDDGIKLVGGERTELANIRCIKKL